MDVEKELLKLLKKAYKEKEIPVAAIVTQDNKIISKAYNKRHKQKLVTDHAEIIAIRRACRKMKDWRLANCELYVTVKPCNMCKSVIEESRIKKVYYYLENDKVVNKKTTYSQKKSKLTTEYKKIIKKSFENIRL